jgi:tetratricopeptide (TPR) repeat protein
MNRARWFGLAVMMVLGAGSAAAEDKTAARQAYVEGSKYYDLSQYAEALEAFKRAYWNYEDPVILFNIAQCHRALRHKAEAVDFYRSYLRKATDARNRDEVQKTISELENAIEKEKLVSTAPPQGTLATDNKPAEVHVSSVPAAAPTAPALIVHPAATPEKRARNRAWVWGVVAGAAAVVAVGVAVGVVYGRPNQDPAPSVGRVAGN